MRTRTSFGPGRGAGRSTGSRWSRPKAESWMARMAFVPWGRGAPMVILRTGGDNPHEWTILCSLYESILRAHADPPARTARLRGRRAPAQLLARGAGGRLHTVGA